MSCPHRETTQAWLNGTLKGREAEEAESHALGCADCQAESSEPGGSVLRDRATQFRAPDTLRRRVRLSLDAETPRRTPARRSFWLGAASGTFGTALAAGLALLLILPPSEATLSDSVADAHVQALTSGRLISVASSDHHTVKPWFATHVALSPPVADFGPQGFALAGGRVDQIAGEDAAVIVYLHGKHIIDLFVWHAAASGLPADGTRRGYHTVFWRKNDLAFAAVSDMEKAELAKFVALVRSERE